MIGYNNIPCLYEHLLSLVQSYAIVIQHHCMNHGNENDHIVWWNSFVITSRGFICLFCCYNGHFMGVAKVLQWHMAFMPARIAMANDIVQRRPQWLDSCILSSHIAIGCKHSPCIYRDRFTPLFRYSVTRCVNFNTGQCVVHY